MFGWFKRGEHFGFTLKPREAISVRCERFGSTFIATARFRSVSVAR